MATRPPSSRKTRATANPMPLPPPVTRAVLPLNLLMARLPREESTNPQRRGHVRDGTRPALSGQPPGNLRCPSPPACAILIEGGFTASPATGPQVAGASGKSCNTRERVFMNADLRRRTDEVLSRLTQLR